MFGCSRAVALVALLICGGGLAFADAAAFSAHDLMPGCRAYLGDTISTEDYFAAKYCVQIVDELLGAQGRCSPASSTQQQAMHAVVNYIEARPARMQDSFQKLAREALRAAFPCPR